MLKNYLTVATRNLLRHKAHSFINIAGLAIGMVCCILILLYVQDEFSYDRYHKNADLIYRLASRTSTTTSAPVAPALVKEYPEVLNAVRFHPMFWTKMLIGYGERRFYEDRFFYADVTVFEVFSFRLMKGDPETALQAPHSIVITEAMAQKYFKEEDPVGKTLYMGIGRKRDYLVTGVVENTPHNSHFKFDFLASFSTLYEENLGIRVDSWGNNVHQTYLLLSNREAAKALEAKLPDFSERHTEKRITGYSLQPLTDIHLYSHLRHELEANSNIAYIFSTIATFVLLIACINFTNLSTARSTKRAREVGLRKVLGAHRRQLIQQLLGESVFLSLIALLLAVALVELALPAFNAFLGKPLSIPYSEKSVWILGFIGIVLFTGSFAGIYPAMFLSAFQPVLVLKGGFKSRSGHSSFRRVLVVLQFAISIILMVGTGIIYTQLDYVQNKALGFAQEQVVAMEILRGPLWEKSELVKTRLLEHPAILNAAASHRVPGKPTNNFSAYLRSTADDAGIEMFEIAVENAFIPTYGITLVAGRNFSEDPESDRTACTINETAARELGWESPEEGVGIELKVQGRWLTVIGVMEDFHFQSLHRHIEPIVFHHFNSMSYLSVRIRPDNVQETMSFIQKVFQDLAPELPFTYSFLDADFDRMYRAEEQRGKLLGAFALLAIFVACLGLFGLASYMAEQRTKEIGIRKVLGATVLNIVILLSKEFTKLVIVANAIAWPVAYFVMDKWLTNFAYRIVPGKGIFILGGLLALCIALATVSYQAVKAATTNPVDALRYE